MSQKRKISVRKIIQTLVTIVVVAGCMMAMLSADRLQNSKKVRSVSVHIRNSREVQFLNEATVIKQLFDNRHIDPLATPLSKLDIHKMETIVRTNPWVSDAQVYIDNERNVQVYVTQRIPVVRIFETSGNSYYLDTALRAMPVSTSYVHYTPVVTGVPQLRGDSISRTRKGAILSLVKYITQHPFWNAQIAQIVVAGDKEFELIPVLGKQRILLGDTSAVGEKLSNLFAFYQQVSNKVGWDKYETIDLRYNGQVVASPSLAWKIPVDRALSNMNWVKAVLEAGDKNEPKDAAATTTQPAATTTAVTAAPAPTTTVAPKPKPKPAVFVTSASIKPKTKPEVVLPKKTTTLAKPASANMKPVAKPTVQAKPKAAAKKVTKPEQKTKMTKPVQKTKGPEKKPVKEATTKKMTNT
jgi:cell division protein FtsQ